MGKPMKIISEQEEEIALYPSNPSVALMGRTPVFDAQL
jgi:hypothetical protein